MLVLSIVSISVSVMSQWFTRRRIEEELSRMLIVVIAETKHIQQGAGTHIEGLGMANPAQLPVVFNQPQNRALVGDGVVNVVLLGEGRNDQQRQPWTVAAASLEVGCAGRAAASRSGKGVRGGVGLAHNRRHHMVIPAVGVVISDNDRGVLPCLQLLKMVDSLDHKGLLRQRIRIARVAILESTGLYETDCGQMSRIGGRPEVNQVILVVCLVGGLTDQVNRGRRQVVGIRGRQIILEWLVMRNVVLLRIAIAANVKCGAYRFSGNYAAGTEAALEPSPGDSLFVKQIADVLAGHAHRVASGAVIKERLRIADHAAADGIDAR